MAIPGTQHSALNTQHSALGPPVPLEPRGIEPHRSPCEGLPPPWVMRPRYNADKTCAARARQRLRDTSSGDGGSRTPGLLGATETLSRLSYIPDRSCGG